MWRNRLTLLGVFPLLLGACADTEAPADAEPATRTSTPAPTSSSAASSPDPSGGQGHGQAHGHGNSEPKPPVPALIGTWDYKFDAREARPILKDFVDLVPGNSRVTVRLAFVDGREYWLGFLFNGKLYLLGGHPEGDAGTYKVRGNRLAMTGDHGAALITYRWSLNDKQLNLAVLEECETFPDHECETDKAKMDPLMLLVVEHTYDRSGNDVTY